MPAFSSAAFAACFECLMCCQNLTLCCLQSCKDFCVGNIDINVENVCLEQKSWLLGQDALQNMQEQLSAMPDSLF